MSPFCAATPGTVAHQAPLSVGFLRQECWSGLPFLSLGIFLTQGSNLGLLHCRQILYCLSHQRSPISESFRHSLQYSKGSPKDVPLPITSTQNMWGSFSFILSLFLSFGHIIILTFLFDMFSEVLTTTKLKPLIQPCSKLYPVKE